MWQGTAAYKELMQKQLSALKESINCNVLAYKDIVELDPAKLARQDYFVGGTEGNLAKTISFAQWAQCIDKVEVLKDYIDSLGVFINMPLNGTYSETC